MTPEDEQCRDVYAYLGVAAYFAQCLEKSLCNFLLFHNVLTKGNVTLKTVDPVEKAIHKKTLGQLLREVKPVVQFDDPAGEALVDKALDRRNFLLHHYFWERAVEFQSANGRVKLLAELSDLRVLFQRADELAKALARKAGKAVGVSDELLQAELAEMNREAEAL